MSERLDIKPRLFALRYQPEGADRKSPRPPSVLPQPSSESRQDAARHVFQDPTFLAHSAPSTSDFLVKLPVCQSALCHRLALGCWLNGCMKPKLPHCWQSKLEIGPHSYPIRSLTHMSSFTMSLFSLSFVLRKYLRRPFFLSCQLFWSHVVRYLWSNYPGLPPFGNPLPFT